MRHFKGRKGGISQ
ncbi:hypothetical protein YPPY32_3362, partial [Yersinia pestis PY-32]